MDLFHCIGDEGRAWRIIILSALVGFWYLAIAFGPWLKMARSALTPAARIMSILLIMIFVFCGLTGYMPTSLKGWNPSLAYWIQEMMLITVNVLCPLFLWYSRHVNLKAELNEAAAAKRILSIARNASGPLSDSEIQKMMEEIRELRAGVCRAHP